MNRTKKILALDWDLTCVMGSGHVIDDELKKYLLTDDGTKIDTVFGIESTNVFNLHGMQREMDSGKFNMFPELMECLKNFVSHRDDILKLTGDSSTRARLNENLDGISNMLNDEPSGENIMKGYTYYWNMCSLLIVEKCGIESSFFELLKNPPADTIVVINTLRDQKWIDSEIPMYCKVKNSNGEFVNITEEQRSLLLKIQEEGKLIGATANDSKLHPERVNRLCEKLNLGDKKDDVVCYVAGDTASDLKNVTDAVKFGVPAQFILVTTKHNDDKIAKSNLVNDIDKKIEKHNAENPSCEIKTFHRVDNLNEILDIM